MSYESQIVPVQIWQSQAIKLQVSDFRLIPVGEAMTLNCQYLLLSSTDAILVQARESLTQPQYANWVDNSTYLIQCIATNLGLTLV